ncbi:uncharacterized protein C8R40DRAFT_1173526 [Lentinula edodes]|uniref:uncharacterized protein n=1 Tax=Lentinula edodes TaxID=5353 RepID=UPI001E8E499F|nr:uncharacterized protein C8R40DRAFT_1173526 [Lentinula edodes]KAH7872424.1 hypothetical protein C8R40DRAFT_1173526 [Lentinula edodes]
MNLALDERAYGALVFLNNYLRVQPIYANIQIMLEKHHSDTSLSVIERLSEIFKDTVIELDTAKGHGNIILPLSVTPLVIHRSDLLRCSNHLSMSGSPAATRTMKRRRSKECNLVESEHIKVRLVAVSTEVPPIVKPLCGEKRRKVEEAIENLSQNLNRWKSAQESEGSIITDALHSTKPLLAHLQCFKCEFEGLWKEYENIYQELFHTKETLNRTLEENTSLALQKDSRERINVKLAEDAIDLDEENRDLHLNQVKASKTEKSLIGTISCLNAHINAESVHVKNLVIELEKSKSIASRDVRIKQNLTHNIETLKQDVQNLSIDKQSLQNGVKAHKAKIDTLNAQILVLAEQKSRVWEQSAKKDGDIKKELETALRILDLEKCELEKALKVKEATAKSQKLKMDSYHAKQKWEMEELKEVRLRNTQLESSVTSFKARLTEAENLQCALKENLKIIQHENEELRTSVKLADTLHADEFDRLRKRETELLTSMDAMKENIEIIQHENQELRTEVKLADTLHADEFDRLRKRETELSISIEALTKQKDDAQCSWNSKALEYESLINARAGIEERERLANTRILSLEKEKIELEAALHAMSLDFQNVAIRMTDFETWKNLEVEVLQREKLGAENSLVHNLQEMKVANNALQNSLQTVEWASSKALEVKCQESEVLRQQRNEMELAFDMKNQELLQIQKEQSELQMMIQSLRVQEQVRQAELDAALQELACLDCSKTYSAESLLHEVKGKKMEISTSREENRVPDQAFGSERTDISEQAKYNLLAQDRGVIKLLTKEPTHDSHRIDYELAKRDCEQPQSNHIDVQSTSIETVQAENSCDQINLLTKAEWETKYDAKPGELENQGVKSILGQMSNQKTLKTRNSDANTVNETASFTPDAKETTSNNFEVHCGIPTVIKNDPGLQTGREALQNLPDAKDGESIHASLHVQYPPSLEQNISTEEVQVMQHYSSKILIDSGAKSAKMKASGGEGFVAEKTAEFLVLKDSENQVERLCAQQELPGVSLEQRFAEQRRNLSNVHPVFETAQEPRVAMKPNSSKVENATLEHSLKTEVSASKSAQKQFQVECSELGAEEPENIVLKDTLKIEIEATKNLRPVQQHSEEARKICADLLSLPETTKHLKIRRNEKTAEQQTPETKSITSSAVEERFEAKCTELGTVQKEKAVIEKSMDGTRIGLKIMKQELDELQSRHADLQSLFETAQNDSSKKMRDKDIEIESLNKKKAAADQLLEAKILTLKEAKKEFEKKNAALKATREEEKAAVEQALEAKIHALKAVEKTFQVKCTELSEAQQEKAALSESMQRLRIETGVQKSTLTTTKQELDELRGRHLDLQSLLETLQSDSSKRLRISRPDKDVELQSLSKEKAAAQQSLEAKILALAVIEKKHQAKCHDFDVIEKELKALNEGMNSLSESEVRRFDYSFLMESNQWIQSKASRRILEMDLRAQVNRLEMLEVSAREKDERYAKRVRDLNDSVGNLRTKLFELRQGRLEDRLERVSKSRYIELENRYDEQKKIREANQVNILKEIKEYRHNLQQANDQQKEIQISQMQIRLQAAENLQTAAPDDQVIEPRPSFYSRPSQRAIPHGGLKKTLRGANVQLQLQRLVTNHRNASNSPPHDIHNPPRGKINKPSAYKKHARGSTLPSDASLEIS